MSDPITKPEREQLLKRLKDLETEMFPDEGVKPKRKYAVAREEYYKVLAEYGDRLPRVVLGACPVTGAVLKRAFDPYGLDGPWWWKARICSINEPKPPPTFRVMLGAFSLNGRVPAEVTEEVIPGPEVPFVIPRLLRLPGMIAVIHKVILETGDCAYPISYWSETVIPMECLYQPWLHAELWSKRGWTVCNDVLDFELAPWIAQGKVRWSERGGNDLFLRGGDGRAKYPYNDLAGVRAPQCIESGQVMSLPVPDGKIIDPYTE